MKQFNLKKYLDNPNLRVVTRDGKSARIICTDRLDIGQCSVIALVKYSAAEEYTFSYHSNGKIYYSNEEAPEDLFFAPTRHEGWQNVYRKGKRYGAGAMIYDTKEEAEESAIRAEDYVTTTKITWEE